MDLIGKRVVLHFPGFERLDAKAHRDRYERAARQSGGIWNCRLETGPLENDAPRFAVEAAGKGWQTQSSIHILDHDVLVRYLRRGSTAGQLLTGYAAAWGIVAEGGLAGYFRHAWRFGLFFLFPFLVIACCLSLAGVVALSPWLLGASLWHISWSVPLALLLFAKLLLPLTDRQHVLHLFADWRMAIAMARLDHDASVAWLAAATDQARRALSEPADEYLITSHSMGSCTSVHVIGALLEQEPELFSGKRVVFATLGSAVLQCGLLSSAGVLRARVGRIARCPDIGWIDVQCLTDVIHFYKSRVVALCGHDDAPPARILFIRFKHMLTTEHYLRIKRDMLRVHRQYLLGSDRQTLYDFAMMTAGPLPAATYGFDVAQRLVDLSPDGAVVFRAAPPPFGGA